MPAKKVRKVDTAIVVAVIGLAGTMFAALLASPLASRWFNPAPEPTTVIPTAGTATVVYSNDFTDERTSGFVFESAQWSIARDRGNEVLELRASGEDSGIAFFGPTDFANGSISFRFSLKQFDSFRLNYRSELGVQTYALYFSPANEEIILGYSSAENAWELEPFTGTSTRPFQFDESVWYTVKLDVVGDQISVWVDGNKILTGGDTRLQTGSMEFVIQVEGVVWIDDVEVRQY